MQKYKVTPYLLITLKVKFGGGKDATVEHIRTYFRRPVRQATVLRDITFMGLSEVKAS
jgi:hypothetical protein